MCFFVVVAYGLCELQSDFCYEFIDMFRSLFYLFFFLLWNSQVYIQPYTNTICMLCPQCPNQRLNSSCIVVHKEGNLMVVVVVGVVVVNEHLYELAQLI